MVILDVDRHSVDNAFIFKDLHKVLHFSEYFEFFSTYFVTGFELIAGERLSAFYTSYQKMNVNVPIVFRQSLVRLVSNCPS